MDRNTKSTLNTHNTWSQLSRLQRIYHFRNLKLILATNSFDTKTSSLATSPRPNGCHVTTEVVDNTAYPA